MQVQDTDLPPGFRLQLSGYSFERDTLGRSASTVVLLESDNRPRLILKHEKAGRFSELNDEAARLRWLARQGIPCPTVLGSADHEGQSWLLLQAVEGIDLASSPLPPAERIAILADGLRRLHQLDPAACPFDRRLKTSIAAARARMEAGLVDESDFDDEREGRAASELFGEVLSLKPKDERLVVAHGDACLPNIIAAGGRFAGFIDCGRLGVADLHQDIALACRSIAYNVGEEWVSPFLAQYGLPSADQEKLSFYCLLDEFF